MWGTTGRKGESKYLLKHLYLTVTGTDCTDKHVWCLCYDFFNHDVGHIYYTDVIMGAMASQITSLTIVYSTVYSGADQRKYQSSASLAFVKGIHRGPVNSPHKWPVTRKMFPFDDVIMCYLLGWRLIVMMTLSSSIALEVVSLIAFGADGVDVVPI